MAGFFVSRRNLRDPFGESFHGPERVLVGKRFGRERPHIPHRHGSESFADLAADGADRAIHIDDGRTVENRSAKLDGRAVDVIFVRIANILDAYIGRLRGADNLKQGRVSCGAAKEGTARECLHLVKNIPRKRRGANSRLVSNIIYNLKWICAGRSGSPLPFYLLRLCWRPTI